MLADFLARVSMQLTPGQILAKSMLWHPDLSRAARTYAHARTWW
jgi:hypothetical protein